MLFLPQAHRVLVPPRAGAEFQVNSGLIPQEGDPGNAGHAGEREERAAEAQFRKGIRYFL